MAGPYYCAIDEGFADATGLDNTGNEYTGPGGLQAAIEGWDSATAIAAGETIYVKGTPGNLKIFVKITVDVDKSGTWVVDDLIWNHNDGGGANGDNWKGVLVHIDATTVWVETVGLGDYSDVDTADGVWNQTRSEEIAGANMTAKACPGITLDNNSGDPSAGTPIRLICVNSSWVNEGTRALLDGNGVATNCLLIDDVDGWTFENLECANATGDGILPSSTDHVFRHSFLNCYVHDCGGDGWAQSTAGVKSFLYSHWLGCRSENNTNGFDILNSCTTDGCTANGNSGSGSNLPVATSHWNCTFNNNGSRGAYSNAACTFDNCVFDGNAGDGLFNSLAPVTAIGCRMTNNGGYGINAVTALIWAPYCYINGNTSGRTNGSLIVTTWKGVETVLPAVHLTAKADYGYMERAAGNWNLKVGAEGYMVEMDLDGTNVLRFPMGLSTMMIPPIRSHR